jgi:hypothetical protein
MVAEFKSAQIYFSPSIFKNDNLLIFLFFYLLWVKIKLLWKFFFLKMQNGGIILYEKRYFSKSFKILLFHNVFIFCYVYSWNWNNAAKLKNYNGGLIQDGDENIFYGSHNKPIFFRLVNVTACISGI